MLTQSEQKKLDDWMQREGHAARHCPFCKTAAWSAPRACALAGVQIGPYGPRADTSARCVPVAALECTGCGLVLTFSLEGVFP